MRGSKFSATVPAYVRAQQISKFAGMRMGPQGAHLKYVAARFGRNKLFLYMSHFHSILNCTKYTFIYKGPIFITKC